MESLNLSNPLVIVVAGPPGSGKSFFATQFAQTFGAALVSRDKVRWTLFAHHTYSDNENTMVEQVADLIVTELFRTGKTFVLDGGYDTRTARAELTAEAKKAGFKILTIVVQTDGPTSQTRATKRDARRSGDKYKQSLSAEEFDAQVKAYQPPIVDKNTVVISGKHTYQTQARTVLKKIIETQGVKRSATPTAEAPGTRPPIARSRGPFVQ
ncbi:ATP-binding protein [Candidatus Saccharibacteria bacterium]|nr:ATP-binding protein [Candidatus Saccharibacteria bacterium]